MFDYNRCDTCGAEWPEREGLDCRKCAKPTATIEGTTMKASEVYARINANISTNNQAKQKAVAEAIRRIVASLVTKESLGPHTFMGADLGCNDVHEVAAALRRDGFEAYPFAAGGGAAFTALRVSVPVPEMGGPAAGTVASTRSDSTANSGESRARRWINS